MREPFKSAFVYLWSILPHPPSSPFGSVHQVTGQIDQSPVVLYYHLKLTAAWLLVCLQRWASLLLLVFMLAISCILPDTQTTWFGHLIINFTSSASNMSSYLISKPSSLLRFLLNELPSLSEIRFYVQRSNLPYSYHANTSYCSSYWVRYLHDAGSFEQYDYYLPALLTWSSDNLATSNILIMIINFLFSFSNVHSSKYAMYIYESH